MKFIYKFLFCLVVLIGSHVSAAATEPSLRFTYLDLVDPSIQFTPVMATGGLLRTSIETGELLEGNPRAEVHEYSVYGVPSIIGYEGRRCIIEHEMALALRGVQEVLRRAGPYTIRVFDAYRPIQAADSFYAWAQREDPIVRRFHHPNLSKVGFHELVYISRKPPHSRGIAVDLTIAINDPSAYDFESEHRPRDFIGIFSPDEVDVGNIGFLAFDQRSCRYYTDLTPEQEANRGLLFGHMLKGGFEMLGHELWNYSYKKERNLTRFYDFPIRDDYTTDADGMIQLELKA